MILLDQLDTHQRCIGCIYWSAWQSIQYCLGDTVGSAGYPLNIWWVYLLVSLTVHPILYGWYRRISWIPTEYSLGVFIGQPNSPSNIVRVILLDLPDTHWIFIGCIYSLAWQSIQYYMGDTVWSAGYPNIHRVYLVVNRPAYQILTGRYYQISSVFWISWTLSEYVFEWHPIYSAYVVPLD